MITTPLLFHISPQWLQNNTNSSTNKQQNFVLKHLCKSKSLDVCLRQSFSDIVDNKSIDYSNLPMKNNFRNLTINLNTSKDNNQNIKTTRNLNEILQDIQICRNQLHNAHGSIHIQACSSQSKQCCCRQHHQSIEINQQISEFENELLRNNSVEYFYNIECLTNKDTTLK